MPESSRSTDLEPEPLPRSHSAASFFIPVPQTGLGVGDELVEVVEFCATSTLTVTVLLDFSVTVVAGPGVSAVLFIVVVVVKVPAGAFRLGVNPGTTPGVLVKVGGGAGVVEVELQPSDIGVNEVELAGVGAASSAGRLPSLLDDAGEEMLLSLSFGGTAGGELFARFPPGLGGGAARVLISLAGVDDDELDVVEDDMGGASKIGELGELLEEADDPPMDKLAHAIAVPFELNTTTLRLPTNADDTGVVERYWST